MTGTDKLVHISRKQMVVDTEEVTFLSMKYGLGYFVISVPNASVDATQTLLVEQTVVQSQRKSQ